MVQKLRFAPVNTSDSFLSMLLYRSVWSPDIRTNSFISFFGGSPLSTSAFARRNKKGLRTFAGINNLFGEQTPDEVWQLYPLDALGQA